jgi:hypothetical protein
VSCVEYWELSNISANIAVASLRVICVCQLIMTVLQGAGSVLSIGSGGTDWQSRRAGCYPVEEERVKENR